MSRVSSATSSTRYWMSVAAIALGAVVTWVSTRMVWVSVESFDDKSGAASYEIVGATWSTELTAIALLFLASVVAATVLRPAVRRVIGGVVAVAGVVGGYAPLTVLGREADPARARALLLADSHDAGASAAGTSQQVQKLTEWASIQAVDSSTLGPALALLGCACAVFGGVVLMLKPGRARAAAANKYEKRAARRENLEVDLRESPDSGRVMWDALDEDIDPTEASDSVNRSDDVDNTTER
ncbi:Tryptophan-associated transmembrane protein [Corynebacterium ciconiae DSM 44920]|uniref:TIGR02234 family membrane protein n=1 Tax=Corynebacterium ciconiae TaxID=227319 RepID=UPI00039AC0BB|nr:TIGR02234 family membrane protein [Corynebacterium ciconiae]WKD60831.1 Tryptophan-associated transmembrane protein [Corynebacterium ciconiae DSM 44920]